MRIGRRCVPQPILPRTRARRRDAETLLACLQLGSGEGEFISYEYYCPSLGGAVFFKTFEELWTWFGVRRTSGPYNVSSRMTYTCELLRIQVA